MKTSDCDFIWPFYKDYNFLNQAIQDINNQSLLPKKIIFVDDGNKDQYLKKLLRAKIKKKIKIIHIINKKNLGPEKCFEIALKNVTSKFFYIKATDDRIYKNFLLDSIKQLKKNLKSPFVFSNIIINNLKLRNKIYLDFNFIKKKFNSKLDIEKIYKSNQFKIYHNTVIFNSKIFLKENIFKKKYGPRCDMLNLIFLSQRYGFTYLNKFLSEFTIRSGQWGGKQSNQNLIKELKILKKNNRKFYDFFTKNNLHYDLTVFSIPSLIYFGFSDIINIGWFMRSIKFQIWKKIRFLIHPKILRLIFNILN